VSSVVPAVLRIAVPAAAGHLLVWANNLVDYFWVNGLARGTEASAGMTQGMTLFWMLTSLGQIFSSGTTAVVARRVGEKRSEEAARQGTHALRGAILLSVAVAALGYLFVPVLAPHRGASPQATRYAIDYLRTVFLGAPVVFLFHACEGIFRGHGDTRRPLRAMAWGLALNMALDPIFIRALGLEVMGAALATVIAIGLAAALLLVSGARRGWISLRVRGLDPGVLGRVVRIGTPVSLHGIVFSLVYVAIIDEVTRAGGDAAASALGLGLRVEWLAYVFGVGCAAAASTLVGQALGARDVRRAHEAAFGAAYLGAGVAALWGLVLFLLPRPAVSWLARGDTLVTLHTMDYFEITAASFAFMAVENVFEGAFAGAGTTLVPMLLVVPMTILRIPVALFLSRTVGWGVAGVFWALTFTSVARGLLFAFWFSAGRWTRGKA
jgi:putative MATE family efflux protein